MDYKKIIQTTIDEVYPNYLVKAILKELEANGNLSYKETMLTDNDPYIFSTGTEALYYPQYNTEELLIVLEHKESAVINAIQNQEYNSPYSYSVLFEVNTEWISALQAAISEGKIISADDPSFSQDRLADSLINCIPSYKKIGDLDVLKFSLHLVGYLPQEIDNRREVTFPILCFLNSANNTLEIRYEKAKGYISNREDGFYIKKIEEVQSKIEELLGIELLAINLSPIVKYIKEKLSESEDNELAVYAQSLEYHTGSKAVLDAGNNDNMILPLIGSLKDILKNNGELFDANDKTRQIHALLEDIILEAEYLSDHPWITLAWRNEVKSKVLKVKFLFNYQGQDFSVLQYYGNIADSERMSYVTQFIFDNKQELDGQTE